MSLFSSLSLLSSLYGNARIFEVHCYQIEVKPVSWLITLLNE